MKNKKNELPKIDEESIKYRYQIKNFLRIINM